MQAWLSPPPKMQNPPELSLRRVLHGRLSTWFSALYVSYQLAPALNRDRSAPGWRQHSLE